MSYQKCPVCNGNGTVLKYELQKHASLTVYPQRGIVCRVCNGCGIINDLTGLPPNNTTFEVINTTLYYYEVNK